MNGEILSLCTLRDIKCPECGNEFKDEPSDECFARDPCETGDPYITCKYRFLVYTIIRHNSHVHTIDCISKSITSDLG